MACCCQSCKNKSSSSCLGRCDLPKHRCLEKEEVKPGPVPKHMGWMYCAKSSPRFQQRCGWRPGHISCTVLRRIEAHNGSRETCAICPSRCSTRPCPSRCSSRPICSRPCSRACLYKSCSRACSRPCLKPCFPPPSSCSGPTCPPGMPLIRIVRHGGKYKICTKPSNLDNSPSGPYPLKYVLNADANTSSTTKFSIEAKFNDYQYDYTSSQTSFILDFSPPPTSCARPCPKRSILCMFGKCANSWPPAMSDENEPKVSKPLQNEPNKYKAGPAVRTTPKSGTTKKVASDDNCCVSDYASNTGATKRDSSADNCVADYNNAKVK
ncbi:uncharacterized protein LOC133525661 isoform X2 [Cydia pomonella]|uniref:uncharacterized protein LOC133525661 isoform X1 n=1 Tax=Cydia pomonella TaxID=82600 RepID=UPI002ADE0620|nr:uncharacterized protein LOC133525661 isoform X1 [Cydia pomonella]XP_061717982.1 uncharacterized protein LOC133525661 isoform X2 [Cydia pomonella]